MGTIPTPKQYAAMMFILENGSATWKELKKFYSGDAALSQSLRSMKNRGWIKKINGRYVLTNRGLMVLTRADQKYRAIFGMF